MSNFTSSKRSSKSVVERKKLARRIAYNAIGVARQQAIVTSANIQRANGEDVDMTDAFEFMTWYLSDVERIANSEGPMPLGTIAVFRERLLTLDLTSKSLEEKVGFVMDVVRAPELKEVCASLLSADCDIVANVVAEVSKIDLSATDNGIESSMLFTGLVDHQSQSIGTTEPVQATASCGAIYTSTISVVPSPQRLQCGICSTPVFDGSRDRHDEILCGKSGRKRKFAHHIAAHDLFDLERPPIRAPIYGEQLKDPGEGRSLRSVRYKRKPDRLIYCVKLFIRLVDPPVSFVYEEVGLSVVSSGLPLVQEEIPFH